MYHRGPYLHSTHACSVVLATNVVNYGGERCKLFFRNDHKYLTSRRNPLHKLVLTEAISFQRN